LKRELSKGITGILKPKMWFSGLRETNWKPFEALSFFLENDSLRGFFGRASGRWEDRGQLMGAEAFTIGIKTR
jgi:hypothetical protein